MANSSGSSLLAGIYAGLTNTYSYLASTNPNGVTLDSINEARTDATKINLVNQSFASYLQTNFNNIDKDGDGIISSAEMTNLTNQMSTDTNGDGRITSAEISAYSVDASKQKKQDEMRLQAASNMSVFYGSEDSSTDTYSILSYKYKDATDS